MPEQSIVTRPWDFACQWYGVDEIYHAINREKTLKQIGNLPSVPADVTSREFAEWLADQYRLAMRKGAELATSEMRSRSDEIHDEVESVLGELDCLANVWGDEGVFRRCRDRLRKLLETPAN